VFYKTKKVICGLVGCFFMFISVAHADNIAANLKESKAETTTVSTSIDPNRMLNILIVSSVCLGITLWGSLLIGGAALIGLGIGLVETQKRLQAHIRVL
jgi:hypothetical protein